MTRHLALAAALALLVSASACGPVQSTAYLLDADVQLQAARTAGAEKLAPYEYTSAALYLRKAREEVGYSDYEAAVEYSQKASSFANQARSKALAETRGDANPLPSSPPDSP